MDDWVKARIIAAICNNFEKRDEALKWLKKPSLIDAKKFDFMDTLELAIQISEKQGALEAIETYGLLTVKNKGDPFYQLEIILGLFGKEGLCQLNDPVKTHFFLSHLLEWQKEFLHDKETVIGALQNFKETSISAFLIDLYQDKDEHSRDYLKYRIKLADLWFSLSPEELGFKISASELDDPQHDEFIKYLYGTGLKILSEVSYNKGVKEMIRFFMQKFIANGTLTLKISPQDKKLLEEISLTEETFEDVFKQLDEMRTQYRSSQKSVLEINKII